LLATVEQLKTMNNKHRYQQASRQLSHILQTWSYTWQDR